MNKEIQIKFKIAVILQRPENSLLDQSQKLTDIYEVFKEQLILSGVSHLLIAWEQYKKANWFESDSINVEGYLMEQFKVIYCG